LLPPVPCTDTMHAASNNPLSLPMEGVMSIATRTALLASILGFPLPALCPAAEDDPVPAGVVRLLEAGWESSSRALAPAETEFEKLQALAPDDARVLYAYALVQLKHRRYQEASRLLAEAVAVEPGDAAIRRAEIWVTLLTRRYPAALVQMAGLAKALAAEPPGDAPQSSRFLGRMFGFLEGPAGSAIDADRLAEDRGRIVGLLGTALEDEFEAGRQAVLEKHDELALRHEQGRESAKLEQQAELDRLAERLETEQADIEARREDLQRAADQARESLEATLRDIDGKLATLERAFSRLAAEAAPFQDAMVDLDRRIGRLLAAAESAPNPGEAARLRREADRLSDLYGLNQDRYAALDAQARQVNGQRTALEDERRATQERYQEELDRLDRESASLRKIEKRIMADRRKTEKPPTGATPHSRSLAAQAAALPTYEPFPFEEEKQRLLEQVR
jgi:hypothetical protein